MRSDSDIAAQILKDRVTTCKQYTSGYRDKHCQCSLPQLQTVKIIHSGPETLSMSTGRKYIRTETSLRRRLVRYKTLFVARCELEERHVDMHAY